MNIFGEIGNFIIKYQEILQGMAIMLAVVLLVWLVVKLFANARKKREILSQINTTVSEINTAVNHLNEKKTDVIYIDSRMTSAMAETDEKEVVQEILEDAKENVSADDREKAEAIEPSEAETEKEETPLKYFSRDCAVSKTGKQYTLEELNAQIRE